MGNCVPVKSVNSIAHWFVHSSTFVCWIWDHDSWMIWTMLKSGMQDGRSRPDSILCLWGIYESSLRFTLSLESFVRYSCVPVARACTSWPNPAMVLHPPRLTTIIKPMMNSTIQCPIVRGSASRNLSVRLAIFLACFFILKSISLCV